MNPPLCPSFGALSTLFVLKPSVVVALRLARCRHTGLSVRRRLARAGRHRAQGGRLPDVRRLALLASRAASPKYSFSAVTSALTDKSPLPPETAAQRVTSCSFASSGCTRGASCTASILISSSRYTSLISFLTATPLTPLPSLAHKHALTPARRRPPSASAGRRLPPPLQPRLPARRARRVLRPVARRVL